MNKTIKTLSLPLIVIGLVFAFTLSAFGQDESVEETSDVRKKVQEKVIKAKTRAFAEMGTITDISETTFQVEADAGEIKQISIADEDIVFVKLTKTSKTITLEDVAIGDFIIAMGFNNGNNVLEAKRILVTTVSDEQNRVTIQGKISSIEGKTVKLKTHDKEVELSLPKTWTGPEVSELEEGNILIAIGNLENNILEIRTIHLVEEVEEEVETPSPSPSPSSEPEETEEPTEEPTIEE